jgi:hypothetical protein
VELLELLNDHLKACFSFSNRLRGSPNFHAFIEAEARGIHYISPNKLYYTSKTRTNTEGADDDKRISPQAASRLSSVAYQNVVINSRNNSSGKKKYLFSPKSGEKNINKSFF